MREKMSNHCPIYESTFYSSVDFFNNFRIVGRYWWIPNRGAIGKIGNDKRVIQSDNNLRRNMLMEVLVDGSNGLTSFRADRVKCFCKD